jgi:3-methylfumaryl-CoA hydratase
MLAAVRDSIPAGAAEAMHTLLGAPGDPPGVGDPLPPLWHWMAFLPRVGQAALRADGHPREGVHPPGVGRRRRMFVGARVWLDGALVVGESVARRTELAGVMTKRGSAGDLVFATLRHHLSGAAGSLEEEQDLVFLVDQPAARSVADDEPGPDGWAWAAELAVDPTLLFRFSALTYNAHRIHYDRGYATAVEGYPGLVVHGPLQAMALAGLARRHAPERPVADVRFRTVRPAFDDGPLLLRGRPVDDGAELAAFTHDGRRTAAVELRWR